MEVKRAAPDGALRLRLNDLGHVAERGRRNREERSGIAQRAEVITVSVVGRFVRRNPSQRVRFEPPKEQADLLDVVPARVLADRPDIDRVGGDIEGAVNAAEGVEISQIDGTNAVDAEGIAR